ncbi:MAG: hypothetical protein QXO27_00710, partial [Candidatus Aenigmatarchaeota archaeon]
MTNSSLIKFLSDQGNAKLCFLVKDLKKKLKLLNFFLICSPLVIWFYLLSPLALAQSHPFSQVFPMDVNLNLTGVITILAILMTYISSRFLKSSQSMFSLDSKLANRLFTSKTHPVIPNNHVNTISSKAGEPIIFNHFNKSIRIAKIIKPHETILRAVLIVSEIFLSIIYFTKKYVINPTTTPITAARKTLQPKLNLNPKFSTKAKINKTTIPAIVALFSLDNIKSLLFLGNINPLFIFLPILFALALFPSALAQIQSHPLSQVFPMDVNLNLTGMNITNVNYVFFGNGSTDTYLFRSAANILRTDSHLVVTGGWVNSTNFNASNQICLGNICKTTWPSGA